MIEKYKETSLALIFASLIAAVATLFLTAELTTALNPETGENFKSVCDIGRGFSCTTVFHTPYAQTFGFPNTYLGLVGFAIVSTIAVVLRIAPAPLPRWFIRSAQAGVTFALLFVLYLWWNILTNVGALCIFCMMVWFAVISMFTAITGLAYDWFWRFRWLLWSVLQAIVFGGVVWVFAPVWFG